MQKELSNGFLFLTIFAKSSILDVWQDSGFFSEPSNDFAQKDIWQGFEFAFVAINYVAIK